MKLIMRWIVVLMLFAWPAIAGSGPMVGNTPSRGNFLRIPQYQTTRALNLFVDSAGSDTNPCTASGAASACATFQHAYSLVPKLVRHPVTITMATGNYTGGWVDGYTFDPADVTNGAYINVVGTYVNATLATGSATGTAASGTAGTANTWGTMTVTAAGFTVNNLKGYELEISGGTGAGQIREVASNTATVITIVGLWTAPDNTSTFVIHDWGTVLNVAVNQPATLNQAASTPVALNITGDGSVRQVTGTNATGTGMALSFQRLSIAPGTATNPAVRVFGPAQVSFTECKIAGNTSGVALTAAYGAMVDVSKSYILSGTGSAIAAGLSTNVNTAFLQLAGNVIENSTATGFVAILSGSGGNFSTNQFSALNSGATAVIDISGNTGLATIQSNIINCTAGGATVGLLVDSQRSISQSSSTLSSSAGVLNDTILSCPVALQVIGGNAIATVAGTTPNVFTGTGAQTSGITVKYGGKVLVNDNPTISGYTNDIVTDSTTSTYAAFIALSPISIFDLNYGSGIFK